MAEFAFRFGELEAFLADLNEIPSANRTAFQARLKNYHRLGFPKGIGAGRGKAVVYGVGELVQMAIILEMTQLGLTPERAIKVYESDEYPVLMAVQMAARGLIGAPVETFDPDYETPDLEEQREPLSMFLYFDPAALSPVSDYNDEDWASATFFYAGAGVVRENLILWTTRHSRRISLINVSSLLWDMARGWAEAEVRDDFLQQIEDWANWLITRADFDLDQWVCGPVRRLMTEQAANPVHGLHPKPDDWGHVWFHDFPAKAGFLDADGGPAKIPPYGEAAPERLFTLPQQTPDKSQPDMIINLPGQRQLFVDAKVCPAPDIAADVIAERVRELAKRPYSEGILPDRTKYVILYLTDKRFFTDATRDDKRLWEWAFEQGVIIVTPPTMATILKAARDAHEAAAAWQSAKPGEQAHTLTDGVIQWPR